MILHFCKNLKLWLQHSVSLPRVSSVNYFLAASLTMLKPPYKIPANNRQPRFRGLHSKVVVGTQTTHIFHNPVGHAVTFSKN